MRRRSFLTVAMVTTFALGLTQAAFGADQVTQTLNGGTRSASNANLSLTAATYSHSNQNSDGTMVLTADDSTGTGLGWNVTIQSSAFAYSGANGGTDIPAANFSIIAAGTPTQSAGQAMDVVGGPKVPLVGATGALDTARKTIQALVTFGQGTYNQSNSVRLVIPGQSRAGTYTGTMTTTISAAP